MSLISESYSRMPGPVTAEGGREEKCSADIVEKEVIARSERSGRVGLNAKSMCLEPILVKRVADVDANKFRGLAPFKIKIPRRDDIPISGIEQKIS